MSCEQAQYFATISIFLDERIVTIYGASLSRHMNRVGP